MKWTLRRASQGDREFLYRLHVTTMHEVIERTWGWDEEWQRDNFERRFYQSAYSVIETETGRAGTLCIERRPDAFYILELQLLPAYQRLGIGTAVVNNVLQDAAAEHLPVSLSVVPANQRAKRLYEKLGFRVTAVEVPFIRMTYLPTAV